MDRSLQRAVRLIDEYRRRLSLRLDGMTVLTEAGSGPFLYSPLIAACAGAERVIALAPDSPYASHAETRERLAACVAAIRLPPGKVDVVASRGEVGSGVDLFLNLGFVRPIDSELLARASHRSVVSYMSEDWEFRPGDVDLAACASAGIPVAAVNENFGGFGVFESCGQLAVKLLFEAGVEVADCPVVVLGGDRFGVVVERALRANRARPVLVGGAMALSRELIADADALVIASFAPEEDLFAGSGVSPAEIAAWNPLLRLVALVGGFDRPAFEAAGIACHPPSAPAGPRRMTRTLAYLGDRPVIALHSLGSKVGQLLFDQKNHGEPFGTFAYLVQPLEAG